MAIDFKEQAGKLKSSLKNYDEREWLWMIATELEFAFKQGRAEGFRDSEELEKDHEED